MLNEEHYLCYFIHYSKQCRPSAPHRLLKNSGRVRDFPGCSGFLRSGMDFPGFSTLFYVLCLIEAESALLFFFSVFSSCSSSLFFALVLCLCLFRLELEVVAAHADAVKSHIAATTAHVEAVTSNIAPVQPTQRL